MILPYQLRSLGKLYREAAMKDTVRVLLIFGMVTIGLAMVASAPHSAAAVPPTVFTVDDSARVDPATCDPSQKFRTLGFALNCAKSQNTDVQILLQCSQPVNNHCDYELPPDKRFPKNANGYRITLTGEPELKPRIRYAYKTSSGMTPITVEDNWTISGITFDGDYPTSRPDSPGALVNLVGNNIVFTRNEVENTPYNCVSLGPILGPTAPNRPQTHDIEVSYNKIHHCFDDSNYKLDRYGTYTYDTDNISIAYNEFSHISGDAFQNLNTLPGQGGTQGVASNTRIVGNRMWSVCEDGRTVGENAVDIKRSGTGLVIRDNIIWGYRQSQDQTVECHGTGSGDPGYGIVVHGQIEKETGSNTTPCTAADIPCAIVEGNRISFSQAGIGIGDDGPALSVLGPTRGVTVRGNYITDMRGIKGSSSPYKWRGAGMALITTGSSTVYNDVYRNTLVNIPGNSFITNSAAEGFRVVNNLIAHTGPSNAVAEDGTSVPNACTQPKPTTGGPEFRSNWWFDTLAPAGAGTGFVGFLRDSEVRPPSCGKEMPDLDPADSAPQWSYRIGFVEMPSGTLEVRAPAEVQDGADQTATFAERHSAMTEDCDTSPLNDGPGQTDYGIGADEYCSFDRKTYLLETGDFFTDPWPKPAQEVYQGRSPWWLSPDVGVRPNKSLPFGTPGADLGAPTVRFSRSVSASPEILLRINAGGPLQVPEAIKVRIWGGVLPRCNPTDPSNSLSCPPPESFPVGYELLAEAEVEFHGVSSGTIRAGTMKDGTWRKLFASNNVHVYGFDWTVPGARDPDLANVNGLEQYAIRAEISDGDPQDTGEADRRPPFDEMVISSNNLAQRSLYVERQTLASANYIPREAQIGSVPGQAINGTEEDDQLYGTSTGDQMTGGEGDDLIYGYNGSDSIYGEAGDDYLSGGKGSDWMYGGSGRDTIQARDGRKDGVISCGPDSDRVFFDAGLDKVSRDCETRNPDRG